MRFKDMTLYPNLITNEHYAPHTNITNELSENIFTEYSHLALVTTYNIKGKKILLKE